MSINAWVDQGDEINGSGDFFGDDVAMDACGTIIAAGVYNSSGVPAYGYKYDSVDKEWDNQSLTFAASGGGTSSSQAVSESGDIIAIG